MHQNRSDLSRRTRNEAADLAHNRPVPRHVNNNEEYEYRDISSEDVPLTHIANYTKGLPHDESTGLLLNATDYKLFVTGIQSGDPVDFRNTPLGPGKLGDLPGTPSNESITSDQTDRRKIWKSDVAKSVTPSASEKGARVRAWESAGAGNVLDLEGPDAQAVTMPPAPRLDSDELLAELAEVYAMALVRDLPFRSFPLPTSEGKTVRRSRDTTKPLMRVSASGIPNAAKMLRELPWFYADTSALGLNAEERNRTREVADDGSDIFRGNTPGERIGPYLSQFLLLGNNALGGGRKADEGNIGYGSISIEQKTRVATPGLDYMTTWEQFVDVQNGADLRGIESYVDPKSHPSSGHRFITTPRDLATYVHYDALYEAYLNACLFLLASGAPFDRGIPFLEADTFDKQQGFAHFGGPHILTLVCEVATRALKAVRYQKFNIHRRLRPEAVGGLVDRWINEPSLRDGPLHPIRRLMEGDSYSPGFCNLRWSNGRMLIDETKRHNRANNQTPDRKNDASARKSSYLLPMAFPEGSPMHPAYGAGHATVAGACVTVLKAYFDHGWTPKEWMDGGKPLAYEPSQDGSKLIPVQLQKPLTLEGELNKLAGNIAIGRNWAGVHYYTDYIESIRMGEEIAIGLLEEQKLTYPENFTMTVPLFDGGSVRV